MELEKIISKVKHGDHKKKKRIKKAKVSKPEIVAEKISPEPEEELQSQNLSPLQSDVIIADDEKDQPFCHENKDDGVNAKEVTFSPENLGEISSPQNKITADTQILTAVHPTPLDLEIVNENIPQGLPHVCEAISEDLLALPSPPEGAISWKPSECNVDINSENKEIDFIDNSPDATEERFETPPLKLTHIGAIEFKESAQAEVRISSDEHDIQPVITLQFKITEESKPFMNEMAEDSRPLMTEMTEAEDLELLMSEMAEAEDSRPLVTEMAEAEDLKLLMIKMAEAEAVKLLMAEAKDPKPLVAETAEAEDPKRMTGMAEIEDLKPLMIEMVKAEDPKPSMIKMAEAEVSSPLVTEMAKAEDPKPLRTKMAEAEVSKPLMTEMTESEGTKPLLTKMAEDEISTPLMTEAEDPKPLMTEMAESEDPTPIKHETPEEPLEEEIKFVEPCPDLTKITYAFQEFHLNDEAPSIKSPIYRAEAYPKPSAPLMTDSDSDSEFLKQLQASMATSLTTEVEPLPEIKPFITNYNLKNFPQVTPSKITNSDDEKIPLKVTWNDLTLKFDLDCLDNLDDEALTNIEYYNMILREDLLPPISITKPIETAKPTTSAMSTNNSKDLRSVSDSMKNLYSDASLLHRSELASVPYTFENTNPYNEKSSNRDCSFYSNDIENYALRERCDQYRRDHLTSASQSDEIKGSTSKPKMISTFSLFRTKTKQIFVRAKNILKAAFTAPKSPDLCSDDGASTPTTPRGQLEIHSRTAQERAKTMNGGYPTTRKKKFRKKSESNHKRNFPPSLYERDDKERHDEVTPDSNEAPGSSNEEQEKKYSKQAKADQITLNDEWAKHYYENLSLESIEEIELFFQSLELEEQEQFKRDNSNGGVKNSDN